MNQVTSFEEAIMGFEQEIEIQATPEAVFDKLLHRLSDEHRGGPPGEEPMPLPLKLETRPGGRWYRDVGPDQGHLWGHVQSIKPPSLIEIQGPMFMSYPAINHLIFRIERTEDGSRLKFRYTAFGLFEEEHREGVRLGYNSYLQDIKNEVEA